MACAIGMTTNEIDVFLQRLDKCLKDCQKKQSKIGDDARGKFVSSKPSRKDSITENWVGQNNQNSQNKPIVVTKFSKPPPPSGPPPQYILDKVYACYKSQNTSTFLKSCPLIASPSLLLFLFLITTFVAPLFLTN